MTANTGVMTLVTKLKSGDESPVSSWLLKSLFASSKAPGFINAEILPPQELDGNFWTLVQRFHNIEQVREWRNSEQQRKLVAELKDSLAGEDLLEFRQEECAHYGSAGVTTAIVTQVVPGMEEAYRDWAFKIQSAQVQSPGYEGSYFQPPTGGANNTWITLLRFESLEAMSGWFESPVRLGLLQEAKPLFKSVDIKHVSSSFPGWIPVDQKSGKSPPNWKTYFMVQLGLYPIVVLLNKFLMPHLVSLPLALASFVGIIFSVAFTTWVSMPLFIKVFRKWLYPETDKPSAAENLKWAAILFFSFVLEIALLWNFRR